MPGPVPARLGERHSKRPGAALPTRRCPSHRGLALEPQMCLGGRVVGTCLLFGGRGISRPSQSWEFLLWRWVPPCISGSPGSLPGPVEHLPWLATLRSSRSPSLPMAGEDWFNPHQAILQLEEKSARPLHTSNKPSACRVYSLEPSRARARHWHVQSQSPEPGQSIPLSCFRTG